MPVSKRVGKVSLAAGAPRGVAGGAVRKTRDRKDQLIGKIRDCVDSFEYLYVFAYTNMRANLMKDVRQQWPESRFFLGNNKVMQVALGRSPEDEHAENLCLVSDHIQGNVGLFFTNDDQQKVFQFFAEYSEDDYPRTGFVPSETRVLYAGPTEFEFSQEPFLRNTLGMPTSLKNGVVNLEGNFTVCTEGEPLTPEQAKVLKLLDVKMSQFTLPLVCVYSQGKFKELSKVKQWKFATDTDGKFGEAFASIMHPGTVRRARLTYSYEESEIR